MMMSAEPAAVAEEEEEEDVKLAFVESEIDMNSSQQDAFGDNAVGLEVDNIADIHKNYFDNGVVAVDPYYNFADNDHKAKE